MQDQNNYSSNGKEFYNQSIIKNNLISDYISELSANEIIDTNVEKVFFINKKFNFCK